MVTIDWRNEILTSTNDYAIRVGPEFVDVGATKFAERNVYQVFNKHTGVVEFFAPALCQGIHMMDSLQKELDKFVESPERALEESPFPSIAVPN